MPDIRTIWSPEQLAGDWLLQTGGTLLDDHDLATAVTIALFTDRTALADDRLPDGTTDRRGWWADADAAEIWGADPIGSRIWLVSREKTTEATRQRIEDYARQALAFLTEDRIATRVDIVAEIVNPRGANDRIDLTVTVYRGTDPIPLRFEDLWQQLDPAATSAA